MGPEQKFAFASGESGLDVDDEYGGRVVCGFLLDLLRLRARAGCLSGVDLAERVIEAYVRHWGEEAREECFLPLNFARQVVAKHLTFAECWFSVSAEEISVPDDPEFVKDPGWEPRDGGTCNFIMI